jgi:hypothetical protein
VRAGTQGSCVIVLTYVGPRVMLERDVTFLR